jgi:hypothetical protein
MTASRCSSSVLRLLSRSGSSRPRCSSYRLVPGHSSINQGHRTSHALSLSNLTGLPEAVEQQVKAERTSNNELHPNGVDAALYESESSEYESAASPFFHDTYHSGPSQLLLSLLGKNLKDATTTLGELRKLESDLEANSKYARAASQCAIQGDYKGCLSWLDIVPNFYSIPTESKQERNQKCYDLEATLTALCNGSAETHIVCLALLKIISKGYLESVFETIDAIDRSLSWLLTHGEVSDQKSGQEWTWQLWKSIVKAASIAKAEGIPMPSTSKATLDNGSLDRWLSNKLSLLYNRGIRTLVLSGRYDAALSWVQKSDSFQIDLRYSGAKLSPFTWRLFLEDVLNRDSPASAHVRGQTATLTTTLQTIAELDQKPSRHRVRQLLRETEFTTLDKSANTVSGERLLDDRVMNLLLHGDLSSSIALLQQALGNPSRDSRFGHLPKALTLARIRQAISPGSMLEGEFQTYLVELRSSRGGKGLETIAHMVNLSQSGFLKDCVSFYISTFESREIEQMAALVDEAAFKQAIDGARLQHKLRYNKYAHYLALKSLVFLCKDDFFKMHKLYRSWLQSVMYHQYEADSPLETGESDSTMSLPPASVTNDIFEETDMDYLFSTSINESVQDGPQRFFPYRSPPTTRPSIYFFNLFLKMLPKALALSAIKGTPAVKAQLKSENLHARLTNLAFDILQQVERFKLEPNASTWSILLTLLARNINANTPLQVADGLQQQYSGNEEEMEQAEGRDAVEKVEEEQDIWWQVLEPEEYKQQWDRIWKLTRALGMGLNDEEISASLSSDSPAFETTASTLPKATGLTYANLIYAFLMVPHSRGGPCIEEAMRVKSWLEADNDQVAVESGSYEEQITRVYDLLQRVQERQASMNIEGTEIDS